MYLKERKDYKNLYSRFVNKYFTNCSKALWLSSATGEDEEKGCNLVKIRLTFLKLAQCDSEKSLKIVIVDFFRGILLKSLDILVATSPV